MGQGVHVGVTWGVSKRGLLRFYTIHITEVSHMLHNVVFSSYHHVFSGERWWLWCLQGGEVGLLSRVGGVDDGLLAEGKGRSCTFLLK